MIGKRDANEAGTRGSKDLPTTEFSPKPGEVSAGDARLPELSFSHSNWPVLLAESGLLTEGACIILGKTSRTEQMENQGR